MCIPRNLVYVFLFVIVFAFLGMLYVIYSEQDLSYFLNGTESTVYTDLQHPLFAYFKEQLDKIDSVPSVQVGQLTTKKFYNEYLTQNLPVLVPGGCDDWPAAIKWNDKNYLIEEFGGQSLLIHKLFRPNISTTF